MCCYLGAERSVSSEIEQSEFITAYFFYTNMKTLLKLRVRVAHGDLMTVSCKAKRKYFVPSKENQAIIHAHLMNFTLDKFDVIVSVYKLVLITVRVELEVFNEMFENEQNNTCGSSRSKLQDQSF
jgi:hypothetical protein